jgi:hypothetical protein
MTKQNKTREEYGRLQSIREWNARFNTPPVCTHYWKDEDFKKWEEGRRSLPPFDDWLKSE